MMRTFGWKAALAVTVNAIAITVFLRSELAKLAAPSQNQNRPPAPLSLVLVHLFFLVGVVVFAHHPPVFMGLFLFFLGVSHASEPHQDRLILREGLLVAFFLAGLVMLGGAAAVVAAAHADEHEQ